MYRDTVMAAPANSAHQERAGPRGPVPADVSRHHRPETAYRDGRQQRRPLQIRKTRQIGHQIEIGPSFSVQLTPAGPEGHSRAGHRQTIALGSCKSLVIDVPRSQSSLLAKLQSVNSPIKCAIYNWSFGSCNASTAPQTAKSH